MRRHWIQATNILDMGAVYSVQEFLLLTSVCAESWFMWPKLTNSHKSLIQLCVCRWISSLIQCFQLFSLISQLPCDCQLPLNRNAPSIVNFGKMYKDDIKTQFLNNHLIPVIQFDLKSVLIIWISMCLQTVIQCLIISITFINYLVLPLRHPYLRSWWDTHWANTWTWTP